MNWPKYVDKMLCLQGVFHEKPSPVMRKTFANITILVLTLLGTTGCVSPKFIETAADPVVMSLNQPDLKAWFRCEGSDSGAMYAQIYVWNNSNQTVRMSLDRLSIRSEREENMRPSSVSYVLKSANGIQQASADLKAIDLKPNDSIDIEMRRSLSKFFNSHADNEAYAVVVPMQRQLAATEVAPASEDGPNEPNSGSGFGAPKVRTEIFEGDFRCVVSY